MHLSIGGAAYVLDLAARAQLRCSTSTCRRLRDRDLGAPLELPPLATQLLVTAPPLAALRAFPGGYGQPPAHWAEEGLAAGARGAAGYDICEVALRSPTAQEVLQLLLTSAHPALRASLRVRALYLARHEAHFDLYAAQKRALGGRANERWLWHGTDKASIPQILANGFLRDYNSRGAFGRGTYFAAEPSYSLSPRYARPCEEDSGDQYLLLVRVLVGSACLGRASMERPTARPVTEALHESMVDRLDDPAIVVLSAGSDHRAFPEFILRVAGSATRGS